MAGEASGQHEANVFEGAALGPPMNGSSSMTAIIVNRSGVISTGDAQWRGKAEIARRPPKGPVESNDR
jgi:hypothetical protein